MNMETRICGICFHSSRPPAVTAHKSLPYFELGLRASDDPQGSHWTIIVLSSAAMLGSQIEWSLRMDSSTCAILNCSFEISRHASAVCG